MKALVTGAAGFVGSSIARHLAASGDEVIGIDSLTDYYDLSLKRDNLSSIVGNFTFTLGDLLTVDLTALLDGVDVVFHQAGQPGVRKSWGADFAIYTAMNVDATQRLLEAVKGHPTIRRVVYASSSSVYGDAEAYPTSEQDLPRPNSPYGVSKLAAEHLCNLYARNFGVPTTSLRYFTVYGPRQRPDMAFTRFLRACVTEDEIELYGSGEQIRDFTFIDDIVAANIAAASAETRPGIVLNVAGGSHTTVNAVLAQIESISGTQLRVRRMDSVAGDVFETGGDTSAMLAATGWVPKVSLREGLERQLEWARASFATSPEEAS